MEKFVINGRNLIEGLFIASIIILAQLIGAFFGNTVTALAVTFVVLAIIMVVLIIMSQKKISDN